MERKLHHEELHNFNSSPFIITVFKSVRKVAHMGEKRNA
jgi:hypothetical protein